MADERAAQTDPFWLSYSGSQVPEVCQSRASAGVAATCTGIATRALNDKAETGDERVATQPKLSPTSTPEIVPLSVGYESE